jgi:signal transduction histidine kinase
VKREFARRRPDGAEVWINASWTALHGAGGGVTGGVGLFMDVTAHRRAREQHLQSQKMEAVGRLASGIAHDFNNLLVSILSCSSYLLEELPEHDALREDAAEIKRAGERAAQLVRQLLAFGRKSALVPVVCDVNLAVRRVETILRRAVGERVALTVSLAASWPTRIDPGLLEQVIMNLAVNARDAMPGGGELRISTADVTLDHPPAQDPPLAPGRYAVLAVADTGCGICPEVLPKVFEPFFTTKEEGRGTGLGLSTVYGIVQEAGGAVAVSSAVGRGTSFAVYLPACRAEERGSEAGQAA